MGSSGRRSSCSTRPSPTPTRSSSRRAAGRASTPIAERAAETPLVVEGRPTRPRPERAKLPGHRDPVKEDFRGIGERAAARISCCSPARRSAGAA